MFAFIGYFVAALVVFAMFMSSPTPLFILMGLFVAGWVVSTWAFGLFLRS